MLWHSNPDKYSCAYRHPYGDAKSNKHAYIHVYPYIDEHNHTDKYIDKYTDRKTVSTENPTAININRINILKI